MKRPQLIGKKFNKLEIIEFSHIKQGNSFWLCKCNCGNKVILPAHRLKSGVVQSCGCYKTYKFSPGESGLRNAYNIYKSRAKKLNRSFDITLEEFKEITSKNCFYCGEKPSNTSITKKNKDEQITGYKSYTYNGIDRIDSNKGYESNNVVPCCKWCNIAKSNKTVEEFKNHIFKMYKYLII